ncbi:hypothetical protein MUK42_13845 [Musa troglodytarum]|uniref:Uncharacterized protein n=1 Tax=Musa troglodytarum TaxID=320322 RepID=A0A9E7H5M0_9LILI|nr:hypothetical protein MUK42_13845 [Musa troglodytarum]
MFSGCILRCWVAAIKRRENFSNNRSEEGSRYRTEEYDEHKGDCDEYEEDAYGEDEQETPRPTKEE